jgi:transposase
MILAAHPERLVFLDESFCKTGMRRTYGWARRGQRAVGRRPGRHWETLSLIGAVRLGDRPRLMTHRGAVNGRTFLRFVRHRLVPWLEKGDVVVMDNLNIHKMLRVRAAIEAAGAFPVYLPTYSPELNPIELWWGHLKRSVRALCLDGVHTLAKNIRRLRSATRLENIAGWFRFSLRHAQINRSPL